MWDEITYPFPNFNDATIEVWEWISNFIPPILMNMWLLIHAGIKDKRGSGWHPGALDPRTLILLE